MPDNIVSCSRKEEPKPAPKKPISVKAAIFFDGTLNNRRNTEERQANTWKYAINFKYDPLGGGSYDNDKSNVALLSEYVDKNKNKKGVDAFFNIYVEGIGTDDLMADDLVSYASGMGVYGIAAKVEKALNTLFSNITSIPSDKLIKNITLDVFGFSRGAAAARNFIYEALKNPKSNLAKKLKAKGYTLQGEIKFNFAGLFDTVSHHGTNMDNDVADLHLTSIADAQTVLQLAAGDEYRYNFPLINVNSKGAGSQIIIPGVHSDVGGGYTAGMKEENIKILVVEDAKNFSELRKRYNREIAWVKDQGWFYDNEIVDKKDHVELTRKGIKNTYSNIPLMIMMNHSEKAQLLFNSNKKDLTLGMIKKSADLQHLYQNVLTPMGNATRWRSEKTLMRRIRHDHFHFSAYYDFLNSNKPRWSGNNTTEGGSALTGVRERKVFAG